MKSFTAYTAERKVERHIDGKVRWMRVAAILCALFASVGIGTGIYESNPSGGYLVPVLAGFIAAAAFAIFWHVAIGGVVNHVKTWVIVVTFIVAVLFTVIALGASAQAIATAVSGRAALAAELSDKVDLHAKALADAYSQATSWRSIAESAQVLSVGFKGRAEMEDKGSHGSGKGQGPKWASYMEASQSFGNGAAALNALLMEARDDQQRGDFQLGLLRDAAGHGDQPAFIKASGELGAIISKLNAVDPLTIVEHTGMVSYGSKGIDLSEETAKWEADAQKALKTRRQVEIPTFVPMSLGEATRKQVLGSAMHGWIMAGAIDVIPLLLLLLAFIMSREPHAQIETDVPVKLTTEEQAEKDRNDYGSLRGRGGKDNVTRLPTAGE